MIAWLLACTGEPEPGTCAALHEQDTVDPGVWTADVDVPYVNGLVRVQPRWPTSGSGWPVALDLHGAWDTAGTPVVSSTMRPAVGTGITAIHMDFPGNANTDGPNDHRGEASRLAVEAVLQWAAGRIADTSGCTLAERALGSDPADLYVVGTSNGGNIAVAALADPSLSLPEVRGLVTWETPAGPQFSNVELGISPTVYEDGTCTWTADDGITCAIPTDEVLGGTVDDAPVLCFDESGDGACGTGDVTVRGTVDVLSGITYVSPPLAAAAESRSVLPERWATAEQARDWWATRDAGRLAESLIEQQPDLPILLLASDEDHVQRLSDHPHVFGLGEALQASGARWTRLNPGTEWLPENTSPNDPNLPLTLAAPTAHLLTEEAEMPPSAMLAAAIHELSDRHAEDRW